MLATHPLGKVLVEVDAADHAHGEHDERGEQDAETGTARPAGAGGHGD